VKIYRKILIFYRFSIFLPTKKLRFSRELICAEAEVEEEAQPLLCVGLTDFMPF